MKDCIAVQDQNQPFHYAWLLILIGFVGWKEPKQGIFLNNNLNYRGTRYANLWATTDSARQEVNNMMFYYYYNQLCKAINSSPRVTREVTDTYGKIVRVVVDCHHIYLQPRTQEGGERHIGYYRMTSEDVEQVIKDQPELWIEKPEKPKDKGKGKETEAASQTRKDPEKDKEKATEKEKEKEKTTLEKYIEYMEKSKTSVGEK